MKTINITYTETFGEPCDLVGNDTAVIRYDDGITATVSIGYLCREILNFMIEELERAEDTASWYAWEYPDEADWYAKRAEALRCEIANFKRKYRNHLKAR